MAGLRYDVQHVGDVFVDKLEWVCEALKGSTRGIFLTYEIHELQQKKRGLARKIGERLAEVRKKSPELDVFKDEKISELFAKLGGVEERMETLAEERKDRLAPAEDTV